MAQRDKQLDMTIDIVTPENISFRYQLAGPFRRLLAFVIDLLIRVAVFVVTIWIAALAGISTFINGELSFAAVLLMWFAMEWFYGGLFETFWNGQTIGKRVTQIRVLNFDGRPIRGWQALLRNFLRLVDMWPLLPGSALGWPASVGVPTFMIGLITPALNARSQRLGDLVAGTMVVMEERTMLMETAKFRDPRVPQLAALIPASFVAGQSLSRTLAAYVERRPYFSPARQQEIAQHVARPLLERFGFPPDTSYDLLLCALYYRTFDTASADDELGAPLGSHEAWLRESLPGASPFAQTVPRAAMAGVATSGAAMAGVARSTSPFRTSEPSEIAVAEVVLAARLAPELSDTADNSFESERNLATATPTDLAASSDEKQPQ